MFHTKIQAVKFAVKLRSGRKTCFLVPWFVGGRGTQDFGHAFSDRTYFRACGRFWLRSVHRDRRVADDKKKIDKRIAVKPVSTDDSVGRPN